MRVGQNPAKAIEHVVQPQQVTAAIITYIPFLSGYYAQGLNVLKVCLSSLLAHADQPLDLMVFDNGSCAEVVTYLSQMKDAGHIQFLILSEKNIGKVGAWNVIFGAAPGEYVAYSDSDVYFYPGWLSRHLQVFAAYPEAGTVSGLPRRGRRTFYTSTLDELGRLPDALVEEGQFLREEWIIEHARSLGKLDQVKEDLALQDYRVTRNGVSAYATATHFQFILRTAVIRQFLPFPSERPMGDSVAHFDRAINSNHLLRLAVSERAVRHLGNSLDEDTLASLPQAVKEMAGSLDAAARGRPVLRQSLYMRKPVKRLLLYIYDRIFRLYYG